ncbi:MAG: hypothetical protein ABL914_10985 [Novosphingobium sp.]|uniref:hypothetical protein n=1 Tax=Novosphingobium sp. TaxID=1874826 RepID=UPI0032BAFE58
MSAPTSVNPPHRRLRDGAGQQRDLRPLQMATGMETHAAGPAQLPPPEPTSATSTGLSLPKSHSEWRGAAVTIRTELYMLQLSGKHGVLFRRGSDGLLRRADVSVCAEDHQSLLDAIAECLKQPGFPERQLTAATLRSLLREGIFGTKAVRPLPNHHTCQDPSIEAPCKRCRVGGPENNFRFKITSTRADPAAHRLSETSK